MRDLVHAQDYSGWPFDPPMPVLDVVFSRPGCNATPATVEAVIDTGADSTLIALDILEQIGAPQIDQAYI